MTTTRYSTTKLPGIFCPERSALNHEPTTVKLYLNLKIATIIPALNEELSIGKVLKDLPPYIDRVIVCDNGSGDNTAGVARSHGAEVVREAEKGYGAACLRAIKELDDSTDILLFIDADYSDFPAEADRLIEPIAKGDFDLVIGSRMLSPDSRRALPPVARFGNWLATTLIRLIWGENFTDLGPFRAVRYTSFRSLRMCDRNFGWTVELQIKAARAGLRATERAVSYRPRIGQSKVSGTFVGSFKAGTKILYLIAREFFRK